MTGLLGKEAVCGGCENDPNNVAVEPELGAGMGGGGGWMQAAGGGGVG